MSLDFFKLHFIAHFILSGGSQKQFVGHALLLAPQEWEVVVSAQRRGEREWFVYVLISL